MFAGNYILFCFPSNREGFEVRKNLSGEARSVGIDDFTVGRNKDETRDADNHIVLAKLAALVGKGVQTGIGMLFQIVFPIVETNRSIDCHREEFNVTVVIFPLQPFQIGQLRFAGHTPSRPYRYIKV